MNPGCLRCLPRVVVFVLLAGAGLVSVAQMPTAPQMPQIPQPPPIAPAPPMSPGPPMSPDQFPQPPSNSPNNSPAPQTDGGQGAGFMGAWCAQGDPTKQASISNNGVFLSLTNENGDTSIGNLQGSNQISAPGWQFVTGTLSGNGRQINWSNGTFWARCPSGGGGNHYGSLSGNWYPNGNRSLSCSIQQHRGNLTLQNEVGQKATGSFNGRGQVSTNWSGTRINGTVSRDGNRINWDNGTFWIRYRLYTQ
jgi:hypothetical protein